MLGCFKVLILNIDNQFMKTMLMSMSKNFKHYNVDIKRLGVILISSGIVCIHWLLIHEESYIDPWLNFYFITSLIRFDVQFVMIYIVPGQMNLTLWNRRSGSLFSCMIIYVIPQKYIGVLLKRAAWVWWATIACRKKVQCSQLQI